MEIKAIKFYKDGFMTQGFAFGGEEGKEKFDNNIKYRAGLTNYLIDTGKEIILVDTGMDVGTPEGQYNPYLAIYNGTKIADYIDVFKSLGYKPEQVTKILLTHKHPDHSGALKSFPNAKIYCSEEESRSPVLKNIPNIIPVQYKDGAYYNFKKCEKIEDGIYLIKAPGHTMGNSIVIVEKNGLYYMIHGDITYTDEAIYENKLSVVFEDINLARETLNNVREFIRNHPTVYISTHTPLGYENLENNRVMDLDNPPKVIPPKDMFDKA